MTFRTFQTLLVWACLIAACFALWFLIAFGVVLLLESL